ncbi:MAG: isochorismatase family protein [Rhizobiaceae bacterium]|nr:isochorismatase family protein [Rhizobiaceae bacterium]
MSATLMLIDMQDAMDDERFSSQGQPDALNRAATLLDHWRNQGNPIIHIRHDSMDPSSPYSPDKSSHGFKREVMPLDHETIVEKRTNNAFIGTDLMQVLEEIGSTELVVCGVHLQDCVESTVRMAGNLGFMVYLVGDATVSLGQTDINGKKWSADEVHALTLGILDGQYAKVMNSADLMVDTEGAVVH